MRPHRMRPAIFLSSLYTLVIGLIFVLYLYTETSFRFSALTELHHGEFGNQGAYGDLAQGFLSGHLYVPAEPDPRLDAMAHPYDFQARGTIPFLWDYSYYRAPAETHGHYYLYWGPIPALVANVPWIIFTHTIMNQRLDQWLIACFSVLVFAVLIRLLFAFYFQNVPWYWEIFFLVLYGLGNLQPSFFTVPCIYYISIQYAATFLMMSVIFLVLALQNGRRRLFWQGLFSLCVALSMGSRSSYVLTTVGPIVYGLYRIYQVHGRSFLRHKSFWGDLATLSLPLLLVGGGLAWYNEARFGNPLESGGHYLMNRDDNGHTLSYFRPAFFLEGLWVYTIGPWTYQPSYPFIKLACSYVPSVLQCTTRSYSETAVGFLSYFPLGFLACTWPWTIRQLPSEQRPPLICLGVILSFHFLIFYLLMADYYALCYRYMLDLHLPLLLLTCFSLLLYRQTRVALPTWQIILLTLISLYGLAITSIFNFSQCPW